MNRSNLLRLGILIVIAALILGLTQLPLAQWAGAWVAWGRLQPLTGPLLYITFVVIGTALFMPGSATIMIGGFLFGFGPGLLFAAIAIPLGAQFAFEVARWVARPWVEKKIANTPRLLAIEAALREEAVLIVVLTRLSLIIPFNLLNYAYGSTSIKAGTHFVATALGMLPAICLYVYLGALAGDLEQILSGNRAPSELSYWILFVGSLAIVAATWIIHRAASRSLDKHLVKHEEAESMQ